MPELSRPEFNAILDKSVDPVERVSAYLVRRGGHVLKPGLRKAPTREQWRQYSDKGDLFVATGDLNLDRLNDLFWDKIEVKQIRHNFSGRSNWPFPDFIVDRVHKFQNGDRPVAYYTCSADLTTAGRCFTEHCRCWYKDTRWNSVDQAWQEFYISPLDQIEFINLASVPPRP